ncbi:MAG: ABC transporter substrate-binding protein [Eubacterium sp.]
MKKLGRKTLALSLSLVVGISVLTTGCGGKDGNKKSSDTGVTTGLDTETSGDISIMLWSGDGEYYEDLGHQDLTEADLTATNVAQVYAVAKKFNEKYPNIKINLWSKAGDPEQPGTPSWDQEMENFKADYGKYPDIWASNNVTSDIKKGLVADLAKFSDDETYKSYNKSLMDNLNYYGFQAGLPSYSIPWGIWVNKSLAADNNIDVPDPDWDIDEFTDFVTQADGKTFWGMKTASTDPAAHEGHGPLDIVNMGVTTVNKQITEKGTVDLNSEEVKSLLKYCSKWAESSIDTAEGAGNLSLDIVKESGAYSWRYFCNNRTLVNMEDPWYLTAGADTSASESDNFINAKDYDFYPFPSTDYCDNTIKLVMDPICLHNYGADDGNNEWSEEENQKLDVAYTFATYWTASTEAKQAIFDQKWTEGGQVKESAANDSLPVVSGDAYEEQMKIWNSHPAHQSYADKEGFQKVLELFETGDSWDYVDKCWSKKVTENGEQKLTLYEWINCGSEDVAGAWMTDANWADNVKSKLADWNEKCNKRIDTATKQLKDALKKYYGFTDDKLKGK